VTAAVPAARAFDWSALTAVLVQTVAQILAQEAARPTFLLEGLVHSTATLLYGPAKAGKSHLVVELVACIANGDPWHGLVVYGGRSPVLVLSSDPGSRAEYSRRFGDAVDETVGLATPPRVGEFTSWRRMAIEAKDAGVGLVVLDNLYSWARQTDINANGEVGAALECLDEITNAGIALLVVHHTTKNASTPAGTHAIEANFRHLLHLGPGGQLIVRGNDIPENRYRMTRENGRTTSLISGPIEGRGASAGGSGRSSTAEARRLARQRRVEQAAALVAAAPPGLSDRALARRLADNIDGIRSEGQGRTLLGKARAALATQGVAGKPPGSG
jgi:hypothetical protein